MRTAGIRPILSASTTAATLVGSDYYYHVLSRQMVYSSTNTNVSYSCCTSIQRTFVPLMTSCSLRSIATSASHLSSSVVTDGMKETNDSSEISVDDCDGYYMDVISPESNIMTPPVLQPTTDERLFSSLPDTDRSSKNSSTIGGRRRGHHRKHTERVLQSRLSSRAYRLLLKTTNEVADDCELIHPKGLVAYVSNRFRTIADRNQRLSLPMKEIRAHASIVGKYCDALRGAPGNAALTSILHGLCLGIGSSVYRRTMEKGYIDYVVFQHERENRNETDEAMVEARQNRILQAAVLPLAEKLAILCDELNRNRSSEEIRASFGTSKVGVSIHSFSHGSEEVVVEIDEELNKQTIYVQCSPFDWDEDVDRVEVCESEIVRKTILHAEYNSIAVRLFDTISQDIPIHRSRSTVVAGHAVGGAVAVVLGILLSTDGYPIKNVISFGAPRVVQDTMHRTVEAITPLRVVISGDPRVDVPVGTSEGVEFSHIGEVLIMSPGEEGDTSHIKGADQKSQSRKRQTEGTRVSSFEGEDDGDDDADPIDTSSNDQNHNNIFSMESYVHLLKSPSTNLMYFEFDELESIDREGGPEKPKTQRPVEEGFGAPGTATHGSKKYFDDIFT
eukprot:Tbor_TRINITY_DN4685_c0_g1::TRINITY_DN4685_c0_g1_i1::g.14933::m.14933